MLILLRKSQMGLFATIPVHVKGSVRKDGTRVADHMSVRRKKLEPHQAQHQGGLFGDAPAAVAAVGAKLGAKLSQFLARHGGAARMADTLASFTPEQRAKMLDMMATLGGVSANEVHQALQAHGKPEQAATSEPDLFSQPEPKPAAPAVSTETPPAHVPEPAKAAEETSPAPAPQAKPEGSAVPSGVRHELEGIVERLKGIRQRVDDAAGLDTRFGSRGRYEADALDNVKGELTGPMGRLARLREVAAKKGVDLEATLTELGLPSFEPSAGAREWLDGGKKPVAAAVPAEPQQFDSRREALAAFDGDRDQAVALKKDGRWTAVAAIDAIKMESQGWVNPSSSGEQKPLLVSGSLQQLAGDKALSIDFDGLAYLKNTVGLKGLSDEESMRVGQAISLISHMRDTSRLSGTHMLALRDKLRGKAVLDMVEQVAERLKGDGDKLDAVREYFNPGSTSQAEQGPRDGERNADGLVFRDGRWHREDEPFMRPEDKARSHLDALAVDVAGIIAEETRTNDFAPSEMPKAIEYAAEGTGIAPDVLRKRVLEVLQADRFDISPARLKQVERALTAGGDAAKPISPLDKFYEYLLERTSTEQLSSSGGRTLFKVKITPAMLAKHKDRSGRFPETEGFALKPAADVTGDVYDKGYILIDRREQVKLRAATAVTRTSDPNTTDRNAIVDTGDKLADYWANSAGASIERDVKAGRVKNVDLTGVDGPAHQPYQKVKDLLDADDVDGAMAMLRGLSLPGLRYAMSKLGMNMLAGETKSKALARLADVMPRATGTARARRAREESLNHAALKYAQAKRNLSIAQGLTHDGRQVHEPDQAGITEYTAAIEAARSEFGGLLAGGDVPASIARRFPDLVPAAPAMHPATAGAAPVAPFGVPVGTTKGQRRDINTRVAAMVAAGEINADLMRQYSGNGGCGDSLNEFYTDPAVAAAQWSVIQRLGITSGTALEPSCATGVFIHTAPAGFKVTGVEMDPISNACARALHGDRHEIAPPSSMERFATQDTRQFKVVVGNPPYGPRGALARDDKRDLKTAESYFVDTSLDKCEAGGIVSLVVPSGIMSSKNGRAFRERMLRKGEFLGAQRLPNSAFEASHTDVTTDVIWLRKRSDDVAGALMTVDKATLKALGVWDDEFLAGTYFDGRGKSNVFGTVGTAMRAFGEIYTVNGSMDGVPARVAEFEPHPVGKTPDMTDILAKLAGDDAATRRALGAASMPAYSKSKVGDTKTEDGVTYILDGDPPRWHRIDEFVATRPAVVDAAPLAAQIERSIAGLPVDHAQLKADVEAWVARYGIPGKHSDLALAAKADKRLFRLIGAVADGGELSDAVVGRDARKIEGSLETVATSLGLTRDTGTFSAADLAAASGKPADAVEDELFASSAYAYSGGGQWSTMSQYLTGSLWPKLDQVRRDMAHPDLPAGVASKYAEQARRLEAAIDQKSLEDVDFQINSGFLPLDVVSAFLNWRNHDAPTANEWTKKHEPVNVTMADSVYTVVGGSSYGTESLLAKYLNRTGVRKDDMPQIDALNDEFRQWLLTSVHRDRVEDLYNRAFRGFVAQEYSDAAFEIPGLASADLNRYHYSSLRRAIASGRGIIADDVGLGKTVRGLMLARMLKMTGKAKRPTFVVPKSVLANWVAESQKWFPGSRVLVIGETYTRDKDGNLKSKPDTAAERSRKYHDLTQNDYDFVFISRPTFNELDVNPILKNQYLGDDFWVQRGDKLGNAGDKRVKKVREQYEQAVADREFTKRADSIWFDQLGIDALIMDEAHAYKNLYAAKARFGESPKFLGGQGLSNQAFDFNMKARHVRDANGGKGIFSLTATPTKNSPLEIYSMLAPVAPEEFERIGIRNSEEFLDRFCEFRSEKVLGTDGSIDDALVTAGFKNLDELREIMDRHIERRTAADVGLKLPGRDDRLHLVDMDAQQQAKYGELRALLAESGKKDSTGDAHVFSIMDKMGKAALDLELLDKDAYAGHASPKYREAAKHIKAGSAEGGQVVFCEAVDAHEKIASALVAAGIPREQIGILNGQAAASSAQRQNLSDAFNSGKLKVIIGNKTMEEGVNLQKATTDIHHLDLPWDPATLQQRNGRGLRQGNRNEAVRIHTYLSRGSFDGYRHQSMTAKRDWMDLLWSGGARVENLAREGNFSREDLMIMMSADPDAERAKMDADKAAAVERHAAGKRTEAAESFVRFQSLKRSYNGLKNKETAAAMRLRQQMEKAKTGLANNKFFGAKAALDVNDEVVLHPQTHDMLTRDVGVEVDEADGTKSRWVVTGADAVKGEVGMRRYADTTGSRGVKVPLDKLAAGSRVFKFDKAAEGNEVREHMEKAAVAKLEGVEKLEDVQKMPGHVIEANYDLLQRRLKDAAANHKLGAMGNVAMIDKATGKVKSMAYYSAAKAHETHDYALPTDAHREAAIKQWMEERRDARIGSRYVDKPGRRSRGAGGGNSDRVLGREHPGADYLNKHINPMREVLNAMDGHKSMYGAATDGPSVRAARARLEAEQVAKIKGAKTAREAISALIPLGNVGKDSVTYPPRALAMAWVKAKRAGVLNDKLIDHQASSSGYLAHTSETYGGSAHDATVKQALMRMAAAAGKTAGLVPAMSRDVDADLTAGEPQKHREHVKTLLDVLGSTKGGDEPRLAAAREAQRVVEKIGAGGVPKRNFLGGSSGYGFYGHHIDDNKPLSKYLAEQVEALENRKASAAAAAAKETA